MENSENKKFVQPNRRLKIILFCVAGMLLVGAAVTGISLYLEGETAARNAQMLLEEYEQALEDNGAPSEASGDYEQPDAPDVDPNAAFKALQTLPGYQVIAKLTIEKAGVILPVLSMTSDEALKISVCYYQGALPGEPGNMVITGHNYANGAHFGRLDELVAGDIVVLEASDGTVYRYQVYETQIIKPDNVAALDEYEGGQALTLLTCASRGNRRLLVRCKLI